MAAFVMRVVFGSPCPVCGTRARDLVRHHITTHVELEPSASAEYRAMRVCE
jgi:hypothetical protein